uniref:Rx N-terminal domain-containing protein n=1 Tax=Fagus sylvatica TaxID=28930 RepID=A0A2N9EUY0_FAGSY
MAVVSVGEAVLSAFLRVVFNRVASSDILDYLKRRKLIDRLVQKLKIELMSADAVLIDAEEKQITNPAVKEWLDELKDAVYVADDLLDEIAYEALRCKLEAESTSKHYLAPRLTTSCPEKCGVFGRDIDKEAIFKLWQSDDASSSDGICVVPIVGMGGIGKTTLAQLLYNDTIVNESFDLKAWVKNYFKDAYKKFEIPCEAKGLRTFLGGEWWHENDNIGKMIDELLHSFKCLRVLSLSGISELPVFVGKLKHLRYLDIRYTGIKHLPNSLCSLYNLQTLILSWCITELPINMGKLVNLRHLDNTGTKLKEMPPQIGKLKNLKKLPLFFVGKHGGSSIRELVELRHLSGKLSISNLENVHCTKDATEVMLKDKRDLSELVLKWKDGHDNEDLEKSRNVLEQLCPHENLNSLTIKNYKGTSFPNWLGDSSFSNMVSIVLRNCKYCFSLPPLGQLPLLKKLKIVSFHGVFAVDHEFYGNGSSTIEPPFRSLEYLSFVDMPEWQQWVIFEGGVFSCLLELQIIDCCKLSKCLPNHLPSLTKLVIRGCKQLVASLPKAPALHELECDGKIQLASDHYYPSLESLKIEGGSDSLWSLPLEFFPKLKSIQMHKCENLESLSTSEGSHPSLTSLTYLGIWKCPNFVSFPNGGLCAPNLTEIEVSECKKLKSLPEGMHTLLPSLVTLRLELCPELESFPEGGLPSNLKTLKIEYCNKVISRRMEWGLQGLHSLKELNIWSNCKEVESFPEEALLPPTLTTFEILDFPNLKSLNGKGFQHLTSLQSLTIGICKKLQCLPVEGLSHLYF